MATRKLTTALGLALVCQAALAATEVRWTGGGSDTRMTTQGNWATPVTLTDGSLLAAFGNGGSAAGVVGQLYLNGVRFDSGSAFTVSAADASADLAIGDGGIAAAKAADYRISAPVRILADQTWELESVSGCKLTISGPLNAGQSPYTITIAGGGRIDVSGGGDFAGSVNIQGGSVVLYGRDAFGSGEGTISVQERAVSLSGTTVAKDFFFDCGTTWSSKARIGVWAGNSAIRGKVSFSDQNFTICPYMNSCVMFEGGVEGPGWPCLREGSGGRIVFTETPVSFRHGLGAIGDGTPDAAGFAYYIDFSVADNVLPSLGTEGWPLKNAYVRTTVDRTFGATGTALYLASGVVLDLCGTEQNFGNLTATVGTGHLPVITSTSTNPAKLHLNQAKASTPSVIFAGNLSVDFVGPVMTTIDRAMTATGEVIVTSGTLAFTADGSWTTATRLSVADGASVSLARADTFGRGMEVSLVGDGRLQIAAGVTQTVSLLTVDGVSLPRAEYQMGEGTLNVLYSGRHDAVDGTLTVEAGEKVTIGEDFICDPFDTIVLGDNAELDLRTAAFLPDGAEVTLAVGQGAALTLAEGLDLYVKSATVAGVAVGPGRHTAADLAWLRGNAAIYVPYGPIAGTDVRWTGGGGDERMATAGNWSGAIDLAGGTSRAVLADGGAKAVVSGSPFLNGISFVKDGFAVAAADMAASLRLASGGLSVEANGCSLGVPVEIAGDQAWDVAGGKTLTVSGPLLSDPLARYALRKTGGGSLRLSGSHGTFPGMVSLEGGEVIVSGEDPLGIGDGQVLVGPKRMLTLSNGTVSKPVHIDIDPADRWNNKTGISVWGDPAGPSEIRGKVTCAYGNVFTYVYSHNAMMTRMTFSGGVESDGYLFLNCWGGTSNDVGYATVVFTNGPCVSRYPICPIASNPNVDGISYRVQFATPSNRFQTLGTSQYRFQSAEIHTTADGAFDDGDMRVYLGYDLTWDLCGTWQSVGFIESYRADGRRPPTITNSAERAATLSFRQSGKKDWANEAVFGGRLDVVMTGDSRLTVTQPMAADGDITVNSGTLAFEGGGAWRRAREVTVAGTGRMELSRSRTFDKTCSLAVESQDSLYLGPGVVQRVSRLVLGGVGHGSGSFRFGDGLVRVGDLGAVVVIR